MPQHRPKSATMVAFFMTRNQFASQICYHEMRVENEWEKPEKRMGEQKAGTSDVLHGEHVVKYGATAGIE